MDTLIAILLLGSLLGVVIVALQALAGGWRWLVSTSEKAGMDADHEQRLTRVEQRLERIEQRLNRLN